MIQKPELIPAFEFFDTTLVFSFMPATLLIKSNIHWQSAFLCLLLFSCQTSEMKLNCIDSALHIKNHKLYYGETIFSGQVFGLYDANDTLCVYNYKEGVQHGLQQVWHKNKKKAQRAYYKNGMADSLHSAWWENGRKRYQMNYAVGLLNGACLYWYSSGMKKSENNYLNGKEEGVQSNWGKDGRPHEIRIVTKGKITKTEIFKNCVYVQ